MKLKAFIILVVAIAAAVGILFAVPASFERALADPNIAALAPETLDGLFSLVLFGLLAAVALIGARLTGQRIAAGTAPGASLAVGTALGIAALGAALGLSALAGATYVSVSPQTGTGLLAIGTVLVLFQTAAEELYFRGWLLPALAAGWGRWPAILASAAAFALLHFINAAHNPMGLLNLTLAGIWFGLLAERSGGLALPTAAHFGWNWAEQTLFGISPNPGTGNFGAMIDIDLVGSAWWGGSNEGLTPSLSMTFALAAVTLAVFAWPRGETARTEPSLA